MTATRALAGFTTNTLAPNDDGSTGAVNIGFNINFFGVQTNQAFVNNNGNITLNQPEATFTPFGLTSALGEPIIAPFFADVDTTTASNPVTYGQDTLCGAKVFGVDWFHVNYFDTTSGHVNLYNTFQLVLIDRSDTGAGNFDIEFNYDSIKWETGDASGGTNGLGGSSAVVGYSNGTGNPGTFQQLTGSGINGAFLDGGPQALASNTLMASTPGRYHFQVRNGVVVTAPTNGGAAEDVSSLANVYNPFRYIFDSTSQLYRGNMTILQKSQGNNGTDNCFDETTMTSSPISNTPMPFTIVFTNLPSGVSLANQTGLTAQGRPYITVSPVLFGSTRPIRIPVFFRNPGRQPLSTFFEGFSTQEFYGNFSPSQA